MISCGISLSIQGYVVYRIVHYMILWPRYLSPLRHVPTAPGARLITGHSHIVVNNQACIPHREWARKLGPVVRFFGLFGLERLFFLQPEPLHQILVKGWLDYPRVCVIGFSWKHLCWARCKASISETPSWNNNWLWSADSHWRWTSIDEESNESRVFNTESDVPYVIHCLNKPWLK